MLRPGPQRRLTAPEDKRVNGFRKEQQRVSYPAKRIRMIVTSQLTPLAGPQHESRKKTFHILKSWLQIYRKAGSS